LGRVGFARNTAQMRAMVRHERATSSRYWPCQRGRKGSLAKPDRRLTPSEYSGLGKRQEPYAASRTHNVCKKSRNVGSRRHTKAHRHHCRARSCTCHIASAIALPMSPVAAVPPTSRVRGPSTRIASTASTIAFAASGCPRCSSIIAPDQICPTGLAMLLP
jgi:hypothetical protein